ncbi:unnamed protein product [Caenorhabditis brenneri]
MKFSGISKDKKQSEVCEKCCFHIVGHDGAADRSNIATLKQHIENRSPKMPNFMIFQDIWTSDVSETGF